MKRKERLSLAQWAMDHALKQGADQVAVSMSNTREIHIEYRDRRLEQLKESTRSSLGLDIYVEQRYSSHTTNHLDRDSLARFIEEAVSSTRYLTKDEYRSLPDPKYYPGKTRADLRLIDPRHDKIQTPDRIRIAAAIEEAAMARSDRIISTTSSYSDSRDEILRVHSNGFTGEMESTSFFSGAEVTMDDGKGGRPADWCYVSARFLDELPSPDRIGTEAADRAQSKIGQEKLESGLYTMIVENRAAYRLLTLLERPMGGRELQQKNSFLEDMIGKKIASERLTMIDDPFIEKGLGSRHFDDEGLAAKRRVMIEKGVLREYYIDNYYGKKLGMEPTAGSTSNLTFEYGTRPLEEMVRDIDRGILVTTFIGGNSNSTTGDFSFGIIGQMVEKGEIVKPANEMNISGNSRDFWNRLVEMGNDPYPYSHWRRPSMLFEDVDFSGI